MAENRIVLLIFALVLFASPLPALASVEAELVNDMAELDRQHITAIVLTRMTEGDAAFAAVDTYYSKWSLFRKKYLYAYPTEKAWLRGLSRVEDLAAGARRQACDCSCDDSSARLEEIRDAMMELRRTRGIDDYILDHMTVFHPVMEHIYDMANDGKITAEERAAMRDGIPDLRARWNKVLSASATSLDQFDLGAEKTKQFRSYADREKAAIENLASALSGSDDRVLLGAIKELKPYYTKVFMLFGKL